MVSRFSISEFLLVYNKFSVDNEDISNDYTKVEREQQRNDLQYDNKSVAHLSIIFPTVNGLGQVS